MGKVVWCLKNTKLHKQQDVVIYWKQPVYCKNYVPTRNVPKSSITGNFTYFANVSVDHSSHGYCWSIKVLSTGFNVALLLVWLFLSWGSGKCFVLTSCVVVWGQLVLSKPQVHTAPCGSFKVLNCSNVDLKSHQYGQVVIFSEH